MLDVFGHVTAEEAEATYRHTGIQARRRQAPLDPFTLQAEPFPPGLEAGTPAPILQVPRVQGCNTLLSVMPLSQVILMAPSTIPFF